MHQSLTRRQALGTAGVAGAALFGARSGLPGVLAKLGPAPAAAATGCATLTPELTEGPYWLDLMLHRSDVTANTGAASVSPGVAQSGVPLILTINVLNAENGCAALNGANVDIWHANAEGLYSDEAMNMAGGGSAGSDTVGQDFLRGYQITGTDSGTNGQVVFKTIWPGWYASRAIHIHVRVRTYDSAGAAVTNYTTQIFFPDSQNDAILAAAAPYNTRSPIADPTTDENDTVLSSTDDATNIVTATGNVNTGLRATFTITLDSASQGVPLSTAVTAKLESVKVTETKHGARAVVAVLKTDGTVTVTAQIERGARRLGSAHGHLPAGTHKLKVNVKHGAGPGAATLVLKITDPAEPTKTIRRHIHLPERHL